MSDTDSISTMGSEQDVPVNRPWELDDGEDWGRDDVVSVDTIPWSHSDNWSVERMVQDLPEDVPDTTQWYRGPTDDERERMEMAEYLPGQPDSSSWWEPDEFPWPEVDDADDSEDEVVAAIRREEVARIQQEQRLNWQLQNLENPNSVAPDSSSWWSST